MSMKLWAVSVVSGALMGCSALQVDPEPLRIPGALLAPCPESVRELELNEDLAAAYLENRAALRECNGRLRALGREYGKG